MGQVHFLAVKYYENPEIAASCVAFLELMGENTELLCLLINAAHILHKGKLLRNLTADAAETHQNVGQYFVIFDILLHDIIVN